VIHISNERDPVFNIALEEWFFRNRPDDQTDLFLYGNPPSVIVGRNQNPWMECDLGYVGQRGIGFARRVSGGGAVYHDEGNLNVSVSMPRQAYDPSHVVGLVREALAALGIESAECERHALWVDGLKILGSAYALTGRSALSHVCVLVDSDLSELRRCLRPVTAGLTGKSTRSVPASVTDLASRCPGFDTAALQRTILAVFETHHGAAETREWSTADLGRTPGLGVLLAKHRGWEWVFGRTPSFAHDLGQVEDGLTSRMILEVKKGYVSGVSLAGTDGAGEGAWGLEDLWRGLPYDGTTLARAASGEPPCVGDGSSEGVLCVAARLAQQIPNTLELIAG
jgi:lipoate---protein ligase